jgi:ACS family tartrate transporter-like MFS transporter
MENALPHDRALARSAMTKALWRIVPLILLAYLFAYMDRVNVSFAALQMNDDLKFSAAIYGLGGGLFFLGYALFEVPSNLLLVRYGARKWIARIMITWGLLAAAMMFVRTPVQFYAVRFLLGVAEAGFYPGVIFYFSGWFPAGWRGRAVSLFYVASPLAAVVMGSISGKLLALDGHGGLAGWQWLFLVQGLPAVLVGLLVLGLLPDKPRGVSWLSDAEKDWVEGELAREAAIIGEPERHNVFAAFANRLVLMLGLIGFLFMGAVVTLNLSAPKILVETGGFDGGHAGYLVAIGGLMGAAVMLAAGWYCDRHGDRLRDAAIGAVVIAIGLAAMGLAHTPQLLTFGYLVFAATCFGVAMLTSSVWADLIHPRQLAVGAAAVNTICQIGAFVMPTLFGKARDVSGSYQPGILALAVAMLVTSGLMLALRVRVMARRRERLVALVV